MRCYANRELGVGGPRKISLIEPRCNTFNARCGTRQQVGHEAFALLDIGEYITCWRGQQASAEKKFSPCRDRWHDVPRRGNFSCPHVSPTPTAEQKHHPAAPFRHRPPTRP